MVNKSAEADLRATKMLFDMMKEVEQKAATAPPPEPAKLTPADREVVEQFIARLRRQIAAAAAATPAPLPTRRRRQRAGRVRRTALAGLRERRAALFPRAQSADPVRDELVFRAYRGKARPVREGPEPAADHHVAAHHLKSHLASVAFPAWCLGHDPSAQILCVSYAQNLRLRGRGLCPSPRDSLPVRPSLRQIIANPAAGGGPASTLRPIPPSGGDRVWRSQSTARRGNAMLARAARNALRW